MGAADLVPGVSGGTVALIAGIYDELLSTIAALRIRLVSDLFREGLRATWKAANASFMLALAGGIFTSIAVLSNLLHHLLVHNKEALYAFFFGLVAASVPLVGRTFGRWSARHLVLALLGTAIAAAITSLPVSSGSDGPLFLAACASIAACAMILPGISGSFYFTASWRLWSRHWSAQRLGFFAHRSDRRWGVDRALGIQPLAAKTFDQGPHANNGLADGISFGIASGALALEKSFGTSLHPF